MTKGLLRGEQGNEMSKQTKEKRERVIKGEDPPPPTRPFTRPSTLLFGCLTVFLSVWSPRKDRGDSVAAAEHREEVVDSWA